MYYVEIILIILYFVLGIFLGYSILQVIQYLVDGLCAVKSRLAKRNMENSGISRTAKQVNFLLKHKIG